AGAGGPVDGSDDLGLTGQLSIGVGGGGVDLGGPVRLLGLDPAAVVRLDPEPAEAGAQPLQSRPGVGDDRIAAAVLVGVEAGDVEVDEAHVRVGEGRAARGREIAVAGADADDHVRRGGDPV